MTTTTRKASCDTCGDPDRVRDCGCGLTLCDACGTSQEHEDLHYYRSGYCSDPEYVARGENLDKMEEDITW